MDKLEIKIKRLTEDAVIPKQAKPGDACMDLVATSMKIDEHNNFVYGTGIAMEIPKGYVGHIYPRSSNAKTNAYLTNHVGVIDSGYRGEIMMKYRNYTQSTKAPYAIGDRIGQIAIDKVTPVEFVEAIELSETERGAGGYGSTGN